MTGAGELLEALPRPQTAHAALLTDVLDVVHGASLPANDQLASPPTEELSPSELRVLRYLPTNLSRPEIASELSVIRINGHLGATALSAFPAMASQRQGAQTVLAGLLDRSALYGVLAEVEASASTWSRSAGSHQNADHQNQVTAAHPDGHQTSGASDPYDEKVTLQ